jgi:TonB family protein
LPEITEIQWIDPPEPEAEPEPEPIPEPEPPPPKPPTPKRLPEPAPAPAPEPAAPDPELDPLPEAPAPTEPELTGTTLVAAASNGIALPAGNGEARRGVVTAGARRNAPRRPTPAEPKPVPAPTTKTVPLSALSRKPVPPPLMGLLERHYPAEARRMGLAGEARVRALIAADGRIVQTRIAAQSAAGFGAACSTALRQSRWEPPLDRRGKPAATWITYRCKFRIDR